MRAGVDSTRLPDLIPSTHPIYATPFVLRALPVVDVPPRRAHVRREVRIYSRKTPNEAPSRGVRDARVAHRKREACVRNNHEL